MESPGTGKGKKTREQFIGWVSMGEKGERVEKSHGCVGGWRQDE